jgi:hypothetical protein
MIGVFSSSQGNGGFDNSFVFAHTAGNFFRLARRI